MPAARAALVGRGDELRVLDEALAGLEAGTAAIVQVAGEQGIGKTRLLDEVGARAQRLRYLVFSGRASEFEQDQAFGVFVHALDDYLASRDEGDLESVDLDSRSELSRVFPALSRSATSPIGLPSERYRAHRAVRALLDALSVVRPVVISFDDLHWADPASTELVSYLLRHPPRGRVLVLLAFRPAQLAHRFESALDAATAEAIVSRLDLAPLTSDEACQLLGSHTSKATRDHLYQASGGNPFYLEQLARVVETSDRPEPTSSTLTPVVPPAVAGVVAQQLAALSPRARRLIDGAAVAGDPFEPSLAAAIAELDEGDELLALDELLVAVLVRPTDVPRRFAFAHPLVRHAVYEAAGGGWRIGAHARAAAALLTYGASASARAHHVEQSARPGDEDAVATLLEAGTEAAHRAPAAAARWYEGALRLMPQSLEARPLRLGVVSALARSLAATGRLEDSRAALIDALALVPRDSTSTRVRLDADCAAVEQLLGLHAEARRRLQRALSELSEPVSIEAATLHIELSVAALYSADFTATRAHAQQALDVAGRLAARPLEAGAGALLACAESQELLEDPSMPALAQAAALLDDLTDDELAVRIDAAHHLGWAEVWTEHLDDAIRHLARGIAVARASGQDHLVVGMMIGHGVVLSHRGRLAEAAELAESAVEAARLGGVAEFIARALSLQSWVSICRGDLPNAIRSGEEGLAVAATSGEGWVYGTVGFILAQARLENGDAEGAISELLHAGGGPELRLLGARFKCLGYEVLTRAELQLDHFATAATWAERAEAASKGMPPMSAGAARRAVAAVMIASGAVERAADVALGAAAAEDERGARVAASRSRTLGGRALALAGRRADAIIHLERAQRELSSCGAMRFADEPARELRRLGRRVTRRGIAGEMGLSRRELEVANLVASGKTNREIAAELFLSERTIETHLSNVFTKLGVSSRAAVASAVARASHG